MSGLIAAVLIPMLLGWAVWELRTEFRRAEEQREELNRSYETQSQIQSVFSLMQDAETGQRGFIITGQREFLAPYEAAQAQLDSQLRSLERLFSEHPEQKRRVVRLRQEVEAKLLIMEGGVRARREQGAAAGMAVVASGQGKRIMDQIRGVVHEMTAAEAAILNQHAAEGAALTRRTHRVVVGLFCLMVLSLGGAALLVWRTARVERRSHEVLQAQTTRQRAIFDSTLDAIITLNPSGSIESVNRAAETMFGYEFSEIDRRDMAVLLVASLASNGEGSFIDRLANSGMELKHGIVRETVAKRRDGTVFPVDIALSEMHLPDGLHIVAAIRDISERKRIERMKDEFVSTVSHELRTPLTSIAGSLGLVKGGAAGPIPDTAARLISIASNNVERLVRLINDILDIEKIESGKMRFDMTPTDLRALVQRSIEGVVGYAEQLHVEFRLEPGEACQVEADSDRIVQVVTNLLSNAAKFSPAQGAVEVQVSCQDGRARLAVRDHGPGVPEAFRDRIFSKFAQADSSDTRLKGGTGLGLAIAREIVERHGGKLHFSSVAGEGATFFMDLPLAGQSLAPLSAPLPAPVAAPSARGPAPAQAAIPPLRPYILHVEDDSDVGEVVASALAATAEVLTVTSLAAARRALKRRRPDLIILDLGLPDGCGDILIPELEQDADRVPVVLYSAQDMDTAVRHRVAAALTKSRSSLEGLVSTVHRITQRAA